ncbi:MAG: ATP-binding protein, partial [SAR324 cluster bacterium]|nr:ATP-binding protein [SAR324 cluster bacterium]
KPARRNNFWLFLDASRSTGVISNEYSTRFLAAVRNAVLMLGSKTFSSRFHVLLLQNGQARWWIKRGTAQAIRKTLKQLNEASGKSHLTQALNQLRNGIQKQGVLSGDRVLLCTDGMLSPERGKSVSESKKRFRKALLNLSQRIQTTLWLHPRLKRGMRHLLPQLAEGTSVRLLALD